MSGIYRKREKQKISEMFNQTVNIILFYMIKIKQLCPSRVRLTGGKVLNHLAYSLFLHTGEDAQVNSLPRNRLMDKSPL